MPSPKCAPYPWSRLEQVSSRAARASRLRQTPGLVPELVAVAAALGEILSVRVELVIRRRSYRSRAEAFGPEGVEVDLQSDSGALGALWAEPPLADALIACMLGQPAPVTSLASPPSDAVRGAITALGVETLRRSGLSEAVSPAEAPVPESMGVVTRLTLLLDGRPYRFAAWAAVTDPPTSAIPRARLTDAGTLPITLQLVAATFALTAAELTALNAGDWVVPAGWLAEPTAPGDGGPHRLRGMLRLAAPGAHEALTVRILDDGQLALTGHVENVAPSPRESPEPMHDDTIEDLLLDTPVVVHIEVGSLSLPAAEWAALGPGDVLRTGVRIGSPVLLRAGETAIAHGELVDVDGNVGVRVTKVLSSLRRMSDDPHAVEARG